MNENLDGIMARIRGRYDVTTTAVSAGDKRLDFLALTDEDGFIEKIVEGGIEGNISLPYWLKIWPADVVLAQAVMGLPSNLGMRTLEIASGLAVAGLFAASAGRQVTVWENIPDARDFIQAQVLMNGLTGVRVIPFDPSSPGSNIADDGQKFDLILASEAGGDNDFNRSVADAFHRLLSEDGRILMAEGYKGRTPALLNHLGGSFVWQSKSFTMRGPDETHDILLYYIKRKN